MKPRLPVTNTSRSGNGGSETVNSNNLISEGTIYAYTRVNIEADVKNSWLASKAEESYSNLPVDKLPKFLQRLGFITQVWSDFYYDIPSFPITAEINWEFRETGLLIKNIEVKNYSLTGVTVPYISFKTNIGENQIVGPEKMIGINGSSPGILSVDVNSILSSTSDTYMRIQIQSVGGNPLYPYILIFFPAGVYPAYGCSFPATNK
jgi:hypothetical protein